MADPKDLPEDSDKEQIAGFVKGFAIESPAAKLIKLAAIKSPTFGKFLSDDEALGSKYLSEESRRALYDEKIQAGYEASMREAGLKEAGKEEGAIGEFAGQVLGDPTVYLIPAGATWKQAGLYAGGATAAAVSTQEYADTGEVDSVKVGTYTLASTILGAGIGRVLGKPATEILADAPDRIMDDIGTSLISEGKGFAASEVKIKMKDAFKAYVPKASDSQIDEMVASVGSSIDDISAGLTAKFGNMADNTPQYTYAATLQKIENISAPEVDALATSVTELADTNTLTFTYNLMQKEFGSSMKATAKDSAELVDKLKGYGISNIPGSMMAYGANSKFYKQSIEEQAKEAASLGEKWTKRFQQGKPPTADELIDPSQGFMVDAEGKLWTKGAGDKLKPLTPKQQAFFEKMDKDPVIENIRKNMAENPESIQALLQYTPKKGSYGKGPMWRKTVEGDLSYVFRDKQFIQDLSKVSDPTENLIETLAPPTLDSRYIDTIMASHAGDVEKMQSLVNSLMAKDGEVMARSSDTWLDKAWRKTLNTVGIKATGKIFTKSGRQLARAGGPARILYETSMRAKEMSEELLASRMTNLRKIRTKYNLADSEPFDKLVRDALENPTAKITHPYVRDMVALFQDTYTNTIKAAKSVGILNEKDAASMLDRNVAKGYFTRIWNWDMLQSEDGLKQINSILTKAEFDDKAIKEIAKSLNISSKNLEKEISRIAFAKGEGKYVLNQQARNALFKMFERDPLNPKSSYLNYSRRIPEPVAKLLTDFQVTDLDAVMSRFSEDTGTAISYAKYFGAKNELYDPLIKSIKESDPHLAWTAQEMFLKDSRNPASFFNKGDSFGGDLGILKSIRALNMYKLTWNFVDNMWQTFVNGTAYMSGFKTMGKNNFSRAFNSFTSVAKGWSTATKAQWGDDALRDLADQHCATLQHVMIHTMGESDAAMTVFGNKFSGKYFELINNPTKWLEFTKNAAVEDFNRYTMFFAGKSFVEGLVREYGELASKNIPRGSRLAKRMEAVMSDLERIGLNPNDPLLQAGKATVGEMEQARQYLINRSANRINKGANFSNDAMDLPILWQSGWMKMLGQFQSFTMNMSYWIYDNIVNEAAKGNYAPLALALGSSQLAYEGKDFLRSIMFGEKEKPQEESAVWALAKRTAQGMGLGMYYDYASRIRDNTPEVALVKSLGPNVGMGIDVAKMVKGIAKEDTLQGKATYPTEFALKHAPVAPLGKLGGAKDNALEWLKSYRDSGE